MDFSYSEEQLEVRALAEKILSDQTQPEQLKTSEQSSQGFDEKLWRDLAQAGILGVSINKSHGGMGFGYETLCLVIEEVGRTVAPLPFIPTLVSAAATLQRFADEDIQSTYLPDVVRGDCILSAAMVEPANEVLGKPHTKASKTDNGWLLNGVKHLVPFAHVAKRILLTAQSDEGLIAVLLDPKAPGVTLNRQRVTANEPQFELLLDNAMVSEVVAQQDDAQALAKWAHESTAAAYCAMAVGLCDKMMRMTASYTSERHQFGVPIATFQAVGHRAADCFIDIECLRLASQQAISRLDHNVNASEAVKIAKIWAGDVTHRVSQASQHLHGGIGVDRDYPLFRYCLWARQIELSHGSSASLLGSLGEDIAMEFGTALG
jgi:alkylation response protein AidB-like acyl-CoA dehydrogenase